MKLLALTAVFLICCACACRAAGPAADLLGSSGLPQHAVRITPGKAWQMMVRFAATPGLNLEQHGHRYLAYIGQGALLSDSLLATIGVEVSTVNPSCLLLSLSADQTAALAGTAASWYLIHLPPVGQGRLLTGGTIEVLP